MRFRKEAVSRLQTILMIDLVIVAAAAGALTYVQSLPPPQLTDEQVQIIGLQVSPSSVLQGQSVIATVNVTNTAGFRGIYSANLFVDDQQDQTQTTELADGETKNINFTIGGATEGTHTVKISRLEGTFIVTNTLSLSDLAVNRTQVQVGEAVGISLIVTNKAQESGNYSLTLSINGSNVQTKAGQVGGGSSANVLFEVVEQSEGTYQFRVGGLSGNFTVTSAAPPAKPAEFEVANLAVDPEITQPGEAVNVTARVTNVGELSGTYIAELKVNGQVADTNSVQLSGGETVSVAFQVTETAKGNYTIGVGNATVVLSIQPPSTIKVTGMVVKPYEVNAGDIVTVQIKGTNPGPDSSGLPLKLKLDDTVVETKVLNLAAGADGSIEFSITAPALQAGDQLMHIVDVNGAVGGFLVVKGGYHTLAVAITPFGDADFDIAFPDGHVEKHTTFWSALLPEGTYTVTMPQADPTGRVTFVQWDDGTTTLSDTVTLTTKTQMTAQYTGGSSCPVLYQWNGTGNVYVSDISNHGWLGYIDTLNSDGSLTYYRNNPWDYVPLNSSQLAATNGSFNLTVLQKYNEIFYLDQAYMVAVDHPAGTNIYSTMVEQYLDPAYMGNLYTVDTKNLKTPISAVNQDGVNALTQIAKLDGVFTSGASGCTSPAWNSINWNRITLNLGDLAGSKQIKLVLRAIVDWGNPDDYTTWLNKFFAQPVPDGTQITPPPYMEVKDASGNWIRVPQSREFPLPSDGAARTYVIDLTGLFPTNDYSLRISNFWNVTFDYIAVDTSPQQNIIVQKINPLAYLYQAFQPGTAAATGDFTKYGNVTPLLLNEDDMFVIGREGDAVSLQFPTDKLAQAPQGMVRDYFLFESCWFKDENGNWGFGFGFTVDPLPFKTMTGFPYSANESYPTNAAHQSYLQQWNTRTVQAPAQTNGFAGTNAIPIAAAAVAVASSTIFGARGCLSFCAPKLKRLRKA